MNREICYTYDNNGNILARNENGTVIDYKYADGADRLMKFGAESFVYDSMGNPTTYRNMTCVWGNGRQLKSITNGTDTAFYTYDEFGVRTKKINGGVTTNYVYENGKLLREITGSEKIDFIYGAEGAIGFRIGEAYYIYHKNIFGDVTEIYDASGTLVGKYNYTAFGVCEITLDTNGIAAKNPIRYRGYYYDTETELYYLKYRYYDPELGRFMTIDGIDYIEPDTINGLNLYAYCGNNPIMAVDPNGTVWWNPFSWDWGAISRFIGGVALAVVGAALTIASLPISLMTIGGGFITQAGFSIAMYGGFMVGSVFDTAIKNDMDNIGWNPFNTDANLMVNSSKVSFYKGMASVWTNHSSGRAFSFMGIWLTGSGLTDDDIKHEWGHSIQQGILGPLKYGLYIGLPSAFEWSSRGYYVRPWEIAADKFGGVTRFEHTKKDIIFGYLHLGIATLLGPASYLFILREYII